MEGDTDCESCSLLSKRNGELHRALHKASIRQSNLEKEVAHFKARVEKAEADVEAWKRAFNAQTMTRFALKEG